MSIGYTTIMHEPRLRLQLSTDEYCLVDLIYRLSTNPNAPVPGWCSMSKDAMQDFLGLPRRTIFRVLDRLFLRGFLEKSEDGRLLKTTDLWVKNAVDFAFKKSDTDSATLALGYSAIPALGDSATLALKNNIYKNNKKEREARAFDFLKNNFPGRFECAFEMQYKSKIKDFEKFVLDFNDTVDKEELKYTDTVLFARLGQYARNWIKNQDKYVDQQQKAQQQHERQTNPNYGTAI